MVNRIVEPIVFGFLFVVLFWLSERNNDPERKVDGKKMRFWVAFSAWMTCVEFASAWHNEIGSAWQNHPDLSLFRDSRRIRDTQGHWADLTRPPDDIPRRRSTAAQSSVTPLPLQQIHRCRHIVYAEILRERRILPRHRLIHRIRDIAIRNMPRRRSPQLRDVNCFGKVHLE